MAQDGEKVSVLFVCLGNICEHLQYTLVQPRDAKTNTLLRQIANG